MSWFLTILGIVALVILHELGHFTVAKAVGMRVERFSLFFPPSIFRVKRGETEYAIGAIPAGGYVKITGMNPEELGDLEPDVRRRAYYSQPPWKRIAVILAGPGVNILIAFVLFWAVLYSGSLNGAIALGNLDEHIETIVPSTSISGVGSKTPAAHGLRVGDRIVSVDGIPATIERARAQVNTHRCASKQTLGCTSATPVHLVVLRDGQRVAVSLYPRYEQTLDRQGHAVKRMLLGFSFGSPKAFGVVGAAGASVAVMWNTTTSTLTHFADALTSSKTRGELHSIVGISEVGQETVAAGAGYALVFLGFLSLVLAVINLFPFLPLDGGHVLWSVAEKVRGKRVSLLAMYRFSSVGILLMLFLVINGVGNDISRLAG